MQAVILAAGRGTRMGALTENIPKPMVPILGRPLLEWKINALPENITEVIVTIGYLGEQIRSYFGTEWQGKKMTYVEQTVLNGTGGSIHAVKEHLEEQFLVTMGDDLYVTEDLENLTKLSYGILGLHTKEAEKFGILKVNENNELLAVTERPHGQREGFINTGGYMLCKDFFAVPLIAISETEFGLPQTLAQLAETVSIPVLTVTDWQPVGCPEDIPQAEAFITKYYL